MRNLQPTQSPAEIETLEGRQLMSAGAIDPSFGKAGTRQLTAALGYSAETVVDLPNNEFLVVGRFPKTAGGLGVFLARYTAKGKLDDRFGQHGLVNLSPANDIAQSAVVGAGGRIILLLKYDNSGSSASGDVLVGLNWRGNFDQHFGNHGRLKLADNVDNTVLAAAPGGKILLAGVPQTIVTTLSSTQGAVTSLAVGTGTIIEQLKPGGKPDLSFGTAGSVVTHFDLPTNSPTFLAAQHDGMIVFGVATQAPAPDTSVPGISIARYSPQGQFDTTFGTDGVISESDVTGNIALTSDDQIAAAYQDIPNSPGLTGDSPASSLFFRYLPDGQVDTSFGEDGSRYVQGTVPIPQPDGKILIESILFSMASFSRLDENGAVDTAFGNASIQSVIVGLDQPAGVAVEQNRAVFILNRISAAHLLSPGGPIVVLTAFQT